MEAALSPNAIHVPTIAAPSNAAPVVRPSFFQEHWELKILPWGLGVIALAYAATYAVTYLLAGL